MGQEQFNAIMPVTCAELVNFLMSEQGISEAAAIERLYSSSLYAALEKEETKVWQYSTQMLYSLLESEMETGKLEFPDV